MRRRHAERWWIGGIAAVLLIGAAAICVTMMRKDADGLGEILLDAVYETFYGGDTNIDKKAALEIMRQGLLPSY